MEVFGNKEFNIFRELIYRDFGIWLNDSKQDKVRDRVSKVMKRNGIDNLKEFYNCLNKKRSIKLIREFINEITVNTTEFFREPDHFEYIRKNIGLILQRNHRILRNKEIRVWCAGCSTGEEAYSIAITLCGCLPEDVRIKILATDINSKVLEKAQKGVYPDEVEGKVGKIQLNQYFEKVNGGIMIKNCLKQFITFRLFNLMNPFPFQNAFDIIFCRNVMIYFDVPVQERLLDKFYRVLVPDGFLFISHSETLSNKTSSFKYVHPAVYRK